MHYIITRANTRTSRDTGPGLNLYRKLLLLFLKLLKNKPRYNLQSKMSGHSGFKIFTENSL